MSVELRFSPVLARWPELLDGTLATLTLSAQSIGLGLLIGLVCGVLRAIGPVAARRVIGVYVEVIRNTPLLVQLSIVFFALPYIGIRMGAYEAAVIGIGINFGAYATEIIRTGIVAIPKTQIEAGLALGMHPISVVRHVILKPALMIVYPALTGQLTLTLLATSIASAISTAELTNMGYFIESETFRSFEVYIVVALIYIALVLAFRVVYAVFGYFLFRRKGRSSLIRRAPTANEAPAT